MEKGTPEVQIKQSDCYVNISCPSERKINPRSALLAHCRNATNRSAVQTELVYLCML
jgi:hypothetical protein